MGRANRHANPRARESDQESVSGSARSRERFPAGKPAFLGVVFILVAVGVAVTHWPVLSAQALSFDDGQFLTDNPLVQNPSWASVGRFFGEVLEPSTVEGYYLPLSMISLMLDYATGGRPDNLRQFHRTSLGLHVINTLLVILLLYGLLRRFVPAVLAGLLFGVHPLTVEPVAWIGERKTLLAAFFALWALILYVRYTRRGRGVWYGAAIVAYAGALLSKPTAAPLPILLLLLDWWPIKRLGKRALLDKLPFVAVGVVFAIITLISHARTAGIASVDESFASRIPLKMGYLIVFYLSKIVWPTNLTSVYPMPEPLALSNLPVLIGVIGTGVLIVMLLISLRWTRALVSGGLVFLVAILPTLGLVQYSWVTASDKYVYLPSIGLLLILAWLMGGLWGVESSAPRRAAWRVGLLVLVSFLAVTEASGTRRYLRYWQDSEDLFRHMIRFAPRAYMPHYDLAHCLQSQGRLDEAEHEYRTALRINPRGADAHNNLGLILRSKGQIDEAVFHYHQALRINPGYAPALANLGRALSDSGKYDEAIARYNQALTITPKDPRVHNALGVALFHQGKLDQAVDAYREALRLDPRHLPAYKNLGLALVTKGELQEGIEVYREALKLDPLDPYLHNNLGVALLRNGRLDQAIAEYREALRIQPTYPDALKNLASALARRGKLDEAVRRYRAYVRLDPNNPEVLNTLGDLLFGQGQLDEALECYGEALRLDPDYLAARRNLGVTLASLGNTAEAIPEYRAVLRVEPDDPFTHNNLGAALFDQGMVSEAIGEYHEALRLNPAYAAAHYNLADALAKVGRVDEAIEHYHAVLRIDPGDMQARARLEELAQSRGPDPR
jgi:tetratricopeptide (TPR) repeat protein